jgi:hypothetical protein
VQRQLTVASLLNFAANEALYIIEMLGIVLKTRMTEARQIMSAISCVVKIAVHHRSAAANNCI